MANQPSPPPSPCKGEGEIVFQKGIYLLPEFSPGALAAFSGREFEAGKDRARFLAGLGAAPERACELEQIHGDRVIVADHPLQGEEADALVTRTPGLALLVRTADCASVFFYDDKVPAVGIAHAGWRGAKAGILPRMLETFRRELDTRPASLRIAIGPVICQKCYEVGEEFKGYFPGRVEKRSGKHYLDLAGFLKQQLKDGGVPELAIHDSGRCPSCSLADFFSVRREGQNTGRIISAIMLK